MIPVECCRAPTLRFLLHAVPPFLALYYASIARGPSLAWLCRILMVLSLLAGIVAVLLMWALYPVAHCSQLQPTECVLGTTMWWPEGHAALCRAVGDK